MRPWQALSRLEPLLVALTVLGFAAAAYRLGTKSLWLDEVTSAQHASVGFIPLAHVIAGRDPNGGLYYALLNGWTRIFGSSEAALRSLSLLLGGLAVPAMVLLGSRLFSRAVGLVAGLLLALSPFMVHYEQTARSYALVVLLVVLSSYFFVAQLESPSPANRAGYVAASALAVYAHYVAAFVLLVQFATLLVLRRRVPAREWVTTAVAVAVLCAPEVLFAARKGTHAISWVSSPRLSGLITLPGQLGGGGVLAAALWALAAAGGLRALAARDRWRAGFTVGWLVAPVLVDFAVSKLGRPLFLSYYLIVVLPALVLMAAVGLMSLPGRVLRAGALALVVALSVVALFAWYDQASHEDYRSATRYLVAHERRGDGVIYYPSYTGYGFSYYEARDHARGPANVPFTLGRTVSSGADRIWLVMRTSDVDARLRAQIARSFGSAYRPVPLGVRFNQLTLRLYRTRR